MTDKPKRWTTSRIRACKGRQKIACLTAYDYTTAKLLDQTGIPLLLVGDSLGMTMLGYENTLSVTLEEMLSAVAAVSRGAQYALVVADMPFMTYQVSSDDALRNAGRFLAESCAHAVKIEGAGERVDTVRRLVQNGIPVMGHLGLLPQHVQVMGGYKIQGRNKEAVSQLKKDALALQEAGAFSVILECVPSNAGKEVSEALDIPVIGIGAGPHCDGQILVAHDVLGLNDSFRPSFVKPYAELSGIIRESADAYMREVATGQFPDASHTFHE